MSLPEIAYEAATLVIEGGVRSTADVPGHLLPGIDIAVAEKWIRREKSMWPGKTLLPTDAGSAALALHRAQPESKPPAETKVVAKSGRPKKGTQPSTESLVLTFYEKHPDKKFWSGRRIAKIVPRSRTAIEDTKAYEMAEEIRAATKAERLLRQARRKRPK